MSARPSFIKPQLASFAAAPPADPGWLFERKYDGYRLQIHIDNGTVRAFSRNGHDVTAKVQTLIPALSSIGEQSLVLDGELCAWSKDDTTDLGTLAASFHHGGPFRFYAFDLISLNGQALHNRPLLERKALLANFLGKSVPQDNICVVPFQLNQGGALFAEMEASGHEGIVAKRIDSAYQPGLRTSAWKKVKIFKCVVCMVVGWQPDRTNSFIKSLVLGIPMNNRLVYCGRVGTGFTIAERRLMHLRLQELERSASAIHVPRMMSSGVRWCEPIINATIQTAELSNEGILRISSFIAWSPTKILAITA